MDGMEPAVSQPTRTLARFRRQVGLLLVALAAIGAGEAWLLDEWLGTWSLLVGGAVMGVAGAGAWLALRPVRVEESPANGMELFWQSWMPATATQRELRPPQPMAEPAWSGPLPQEAVGIRRVTAGDGQAPAIAGIGAGRTTSGLKSVPTPAVAPGRAPSAQHAIPARKGPATDCPSCGERALWTGITERDLGRIFGRYGCTSCGNRFAEWSEAGAEVFERTHADLEHAARALLGAAVTWRPHAGKDQPWQVEYGGRTWVVHVLARRDRPPIYGLEIDGVVFALFDEWPLVWRRPA
jgi:predicted RNA-binding Zn-ribbon protein involved in translation (DUF1610 family)